MAIDFVEDEGEQQDAEPTMNTTPLIDVLLVLLVVLMITMPIQMHSVHMDLPGRAPPPEAPVPLVVRLEISSTSQVHWNGEPLPDRAALEERLREVAQLAQQPEIHVHADPRTKYDAVAAVLTSTQRQGLLKVGVVGLEGYL